MKKEEGEMTAKKKKWRREAKLTKNQRQATKEARTEQMKGMQENGQAETPTGDEQKRKISGGQKRKKKTRGSK